MKPLRSAIRRLSIMAGVEVEPEDPEVAVSVRKATVSGGAEDFYRLPVVSMSGVREVIALSIMVQSVFNRGTLPLRTTRPSMTRAGSRMTRWSAITDGLSTTSTGESIPKASRAARVLAVSARQRAPCAEDLHGRRVGSWFHSHGRFSSSKVAWVISNRSSSIALIRSAIAWAASRDGWPLATMCADSAMVSDARCQAWR